MRFRPGVSNTVFAGSVIALIIVASIGFALYLTKPSSDAMAHTTTDNMTSSTTDHMTATDTVSSSTAGAAAPTAIAFNASRGQMFHGGWLIVAPTGTGSYVLSIHAEGLENTQSMHDVYLVEGVQSSGSMASVPIGQNATLSEFEVGSNGVGNFFSILTQNPFSNYESVTIVFLPGMQMNNATVVATASLSMAMH
jgi:hypothetical protein